jgi:hypothetical protein
LFLIKGLLALSSFFIAGTMPFFCKKALTIVRADWRINAAPLLSTNSPRNELVLLILNMNPITKTPVDFFRYLREKNLIKTKYGYCI